jgi:hypothetical protein
MEWVAEMQAKRLGYQASGNATESGWPRQGVTRWEAGVGSSG